MKKLAVLLLCVMMLTGCGSQESRSVDKLIEAIGPVDATFGPVLEYVRAEYELLSEEDKSSLKNYQLLLQSEASYVDTLIHGVGEVTPDSMGAIELAESAYDALTEEAKALVTSLEELRSAKEACILKTVQEMVTGSWVNEVLGSSNVQIGRNLIRSYGLDETNCDPAVPEDGCFTLREDGVLLRGETETGTWEISEDRTAVEITADRKQYDLKILHEDGYTKLVGQVFDNQPFAYVQEQDYLAAFREKYVCADISKENIHDYIADPVQIGKLTTAEDEVHNIFWFASEVYDDGLVYLDASCVIPVDYDHGGKTYHMWLEFPMLSTSKLKIKDIRINTSARLSGEIYYVKADHVEKNYINADGFRVLELTNGISIVYDGYSDTMNTFWHRTDLSYEDYIY